MCGRVTLTTPDVHEVARLLEARIAPADAALYRPRWNAAPTDRHWVVEPSPQGRVLLPARWGFRSGAINARSETVERVFRKPFAQRLRGGARRRLLRMDRAQKRPPASLVSSAGGRDALSRRARGDPA